MIRINGISRYVLYCLLYLFLSYALSILFTVIMFFILRTDNYNCRECGLSVILSASLINMISVLIVVIQYWKLYIDGYGDNRKLHFITPIFTGIVTFIILILGLMNGEIWSFMYIIPTLCQILMSYFFANSFDKIFLNET
jgi:heme/copper-type cytochrome/quinol oxidase subunit 4